MSDTTQTNAMAEIALALAMGFFSIMVLTMVSMGGGMVSQMSQSAIKDDPISIAKSADKPQEETNDGNSQNVQPQNLVIFYKGQFLDHDLNSLKPADLGGRAKVVLAVSPDLSMSNTMAARKQVSVTDITVVVLNETWLSALQEAGL